VAMIATAIGRGRSWRIRDRRIGHWAVGDQPCLDSGKLKSLEIQDLTVTRLHAAEITVSDSLKPPGSNVDPRIS
jgi:hypothetical protein